MEYYTEIGNSKEGEGFHVESSLRLIANYWNFVEEESFAGSLVSKIGKEMRKCISYTYRVQVFPKDVESYQLQIKRILKA